MQGSNICYLDLSSIKESLVTHYKWTKSEADKTEFLYKRFLYLKLKYGHIGWIVPSLEIDEFWHCHILDTKKYHHDCMLIFGQYLHHNPAKSLEVTERMFEETQKIYFMEYGEYIGVVNKKLYKSTWRTCYEKVIKYFIR